MVYTRITVVNKHNSSHMEEISKEKITKFFKYTLKNRLKMIVFDKFFES